MKYIIGVDGGGTKTALEAVGTDGSERKVTFGALNYNFIGIDAALSHIRDGLSAMEIVPENVSAIAVGDPAIDDYPVGDASLAFLHRLEAMLPNAAVYIRSDAYMALYSLTRGASGAAVIAGTGAMGIAEDDSGNVLFSGGWGRLTADEGGGFYIGTRAVRAALRYADGIDPPTILLDALLDFCGCRSPRQLIEAFYGNPPFAPASFASAVAQCAENGDAAALEILKDAAWRLYEMADSLLRKCGFTNRVIPVGTVGSVIRKNPIVRAEFERLMLAAYPLAEIRESDISPEHAAVLYAQARL